MEKIILIILVFMLGVIIWLNLSEDENESDYIFEERVVGKCDTFWGYYNNEGYYSDMCYEEALYTFKKDNGKQNYSLVEGETVILRKVIK